MTEEIDDDILEAELEDDALEKKMKKLESEAARLLNLSSELLKELSKDSERKEETTERIMNSVPRHYVPGIVPLTLRAALSLLSASVTKG